MAGPKFIMLFTIATVITGIGISLWMKHGYDTRPLNVIPQQSAPATTEAPNTQPTTTDSKSEYGQPTK